MASAHPLLPREYAGSEFQQSVLYALRPYERPFAMDQTLPQFCWDLEQAWEDGMADLARSSWRIHSESLEHQPATYVFCADTERETERLYAIAAAITARHLLEPESGIRLSDLRHMRGGEILLIIDHIAAMALRRHFPRLKLQQPGISPTPNTSQGFSLRGLLLSTLGV